MSLFGLEAILAAVRISQYQLFKTEEDAYFTNISCNLPVGTYMYIPSGKSAPMGTAPWGKRHLSPLDFEYTCIYMYHYKCIGATKIVGKVSITDEIIGVSQLLGARARAALSSLRLC